MSFLKNIINISLYPISSHIKTLPSKTYISLFSEVVNDSNALKCSTLFSVTADQTAPSQTPGQSIVSAATFQARRCSTPFKRTHSIRSPSQRRKKRRIRKEFRGFKQLAQPHSYEPPSFPLGCYDNSDSGPRP